MGYRNGGNQVCPVILDPFQINPITFKLKNGPKQSSRVCSRVHHSTPVLRLLTKMRTSRGISKLRMMRRKRTRKSSIRFMSLYNRRADRMVRSNK